MGGTYESKVWPRTADALGFCTGEQGKGVAVK